MEILHVLPEEGADLPRDAAALSDPLHALPEREIVVGQIEIITLYSRIITDQSCTKKHEDVEWYHFQPLGLFLLD